jgi:hypothetical protein
VLPPAVSIDKFPGIETGGVANLDIKGNEDTPGKFENVGTKLAPAAGFPKPAALAKFPACPKLYPVKAPAAVFSNLFRPPIP